MLEARNICKNYNTGTSKLQVLRGISLKINKGEFISIFGPSGAGKSTLLHILGGLDKPTDGAILLDGESIYDLGDNKKARIRNRKIGFVFQFYHLLPEFSALENVMLPALIREGYRVQGTGYREKAQKLLELVGLKDRIKHKPNQLSGGEQQRVAIARAIINDPPLLLCDEPTGNLDSVSGMEIIGLLDRLNKENKTTVIVVTHEDAIAKKTDRVFNIKDGKLQ